MKRGMKEREGESEGESEGENEGERSGRRHPTTGVAEDSKAVGRERRLQSSCVTFRPRSIHYNV